MDIIRVGIHVHQPLLRVLFFHLIKICCSLLFFCQEAKKQSEGVRFFPGHLLVYTTSRFPCVPLCWVQNSFGWTKYEADTLNGCVVFKVGPCKAASAFLLVFHLKPQRGEPSPNLTFCVPQMGVEREANRLFEQQIKHARGCLTPSV